MNRRLVLVVAMVLIPVTFQVVCVAEDWVQTTAAVRIWPVGDGGNGHAYQGVAVPELIPWTSADRMASLAGGYLATITSQAENDFVYAMSADLFIQAMGNEYGPWLGGYQLPGSSEPAGGWVWVTGEPFEYTAWATGEPSQTAGPLNEDRIHYLGHGGPAPVWNDQTNSGDFGPMAYVVEYDPVTFEAEDAAAMPDGRIETAFAGYSGTGYVRLEGQPEVIRWIVHLGTAESKAILLRYSNGASRDIGVQVTVNGTVVEPNLLCVSTGAWDAWGSVTAHAGFNMGENVVEVRGLAEGASLVIDKITVFGDTTNVALNHCIAFSAEAPAYPASQAVDADTRTCWKAEVLPQWLEVDLGDVYRVHRTQLVGSQWQVCQFRVEVKAQAGDAYVQVVDRTSNMALGTAIEPITDTFEPTSARYVRLTVTGADWGDPEIAEFRVSAATGQVPSIAIGSVGYRTIQAAIDSAGHGDVIVLQPGQYSGAGNQGIAMNGKRITLTSIDPNDSRIVAATVISGTEAGPALSLTNGEDANCVLAGLTISGAQAAIYCNRASPTIRNCRLVGNSLAGIELYSNTRPTIRHCIIAGNRGPGIMMDSQQGRTGLYYNYPQIINCTIVENLGYAIKGGSPTVVNSILYSNGVGADGKQINSRSLTVTYSDVQGGCPGDGNLDVDPCFARSGAWGGPDGATWVSGDYHLRSQAGRWDADAQQWVVDAATSPCIDAGDPAMDPGPERSPNGGRINLGAYGGTGEAAMSP
jgi:parallel beta-helix repeat protein